MIASKRRPTVPCELCVRWVRSKQDGEMMCRKFQHRMTAADGCTRGEYEADVTRRR